MSEPAPHLVPITHDQFVADIRTVATAVAANGWRPDHIVGIGRGGLTPAVYLSHALGIAMLSIDQSADDPAFSAMLVEKLAQHCAQDARLLFIDDINDSGSTIAGLRMAMEAGGAPAGSMRVAVLLDNVRSSARADYRARTIDRANDKGWYVFPWEAMAPRDRVIDDARAVPDRLA